MVATLTRARRKTMSITPPTRVRQPSVMSTRLTGNEPSKTSREMTQIPEKAMKKLTAMSDFLPYTNWKSRKKPGVCRDDVGSEQFSQ